MRTGIKILAEVSPRGGSTDMFNFILGGVDE
jgi:hypothetical protein